METHLKNTMTEELKDGMDSGKVDDGVKPQLFVNSIDICAAPERWKANWHTLNTLFDYPPDIRKAIYTTHAIESLNRVIRKAIKKHKLFPGDDAAKKVVYLAMQQAAKKWTMPI